VKIYTINYDLRKQRNYEHLYDAIKSYSNWAHPLESMWVILSNKTATQIRDHLVQHIDGDDQLIVAGATGEAAWLNLGDDVSRWLKQHMSTNAIA